MKRSILLRWIAVPVSLALGSSALASNQYALDDGQPNSGLSYGIPADYGWLQSFNTVGPTDALTQLSVMWQPGSLPPGKVVHLCVWEDPNDDGDPYDAILVRQVDGFVGSAPSLTYTNYPVLNPAVVHGGFFIGAYLTTNGSAGTISLLDYDSSFSHRAWFATNAPGGFDAAQLGNNNPNHIEILGAGIHGVFMLRAEGTGLVPTTYCTAKTNSLGCVPQIGYLGTPSASSGSGFFLLASNELNRKSGVLVYSITGRASVPFYGGMLCLAAPRRRTASVNSGGSASGNDCTGVFNFDFAAWTATGLDPALVAGAMVNAQFYSRDPGFAEPNNIALTNAIEFNLAP